jgi:hypothetical protein
VQLTLPKPLKKQILHDTTVAELNAEMGALKEQGAIAYPTEFVLDTSEVRGKTYYRKRQRISTGAPSTAKMISKSEYADFKQQLVNGRNIHRLEKKKAAMVAKLDAIAAQARETGLLLPR